MVVRPQSASLHAMAVEQGGSPLHPPFQVPSNASSIFELHVDAEARVNGSMVPVGTSAGRWHTVCPPVQHPSCMASPSLQWRNSTEQTCLVSPAGELGAAGAPRRHRRGAGGQEGESALLPASSVPCI